MEPMGKGRPESDLGGPEAVADEAFRMMALGLAF